MIRLFFIHFELRNIRIEKLWAYRKEGKIIFFRIFLSSTYNDAKNTWWRRQVKVTKSVDNKGFIILY